LNLGRKGPFLKSKFQDPNSKGRSKGCRFLSIIRNPRYNLPIIYLWVFGFLVPGFLNFGFLQNHNVLSLFLNKQRAVVIYVFIIFGNSNKHVAFYIFAD
jgi:hypothetical protein